MIALLIYEGRVPGRPKAQKIFELWHRHYQLSGTKMPFKIFTDVESSIDLGFAPIRIKSKPPVSRDCLTYGDWLRSELFDTIQEPFVYMDLDCLLFRPLTEEIFNIPQKMGMARDIFHERRTGIREFNSGVLVFKENVKKLYQTTFEINPNDEDQETAYYGQHIWSYVNRIVGTQIGTKYNYLINLLFAKKVVPEDTIVIHFTGGTLTAIVAMLTAFASLHGSDLSYIDDLV